MVTEDVMRTIRQNADANFRGWVEVTELAFTLRAARLRQLYSGLPDDEIGKLLCRDLLEQKDRAWRTS